MNAKFPDDICPAQLYGAARVLTYSQQLEEEFLRQQGWAYSSHFFAYWFWCKEIGGIQFCCDKQTALTVASKLYKPNTTKKENSNVRV